MASTTAPDFARERRLIEQLEFRIASADSGEKLQGILLKFLPALLLKLGSEDTHNRNLTIKVSQYINQRLKIDNSIQLPVEGLSKCFRDSPSAFVKQFSLLFIQQGLSRLPAQAGISTLPAVLRSSILVRNQDQNDQKLFAVAIDFLLRTLSHWHPPEHGSKEDEVLGPSWELASEQTQVISKQLSFFLLYDPKAPALPYIADELKPIFEKHFPYRGSIVPNIANFIFTSVFHDGERFMPALILSVDANSTANARADVMFKQCDFDLESEPLIDGTFDLYTVASPRLQTRILTLLTRSKASTSRVERIVQIIQSLLHSPSANLEANKLRAAMFSYLTWAIRIGPDLYRVAHQIQSDLRDFIEHQGWPSASNLSFSDAELRARAYESIGLLSSLRREVPQSDDTDMEYDVNNSRFDLVSWLFTSLRCDNAREVRHSIEESLGRLMASTTLDQLEERKKFKDLLMWNVVAGEGDEDPLYHFSTRRIVKYPAVRFANKLLPFSDVGARIIDLVALSSDRKEIVDEGQRGLDPSWHTANARIGEAPAVAAQTLPTFSEFAEAVFVDGAGSKEGNALLSLPPALAGIVSFSRNLIAAQAWKATRFSAEDDVDWQRKIDATIENEAEARSLFKNALNGEARYHLNRLLQTSIQGMSTGSTECARVGLQIVSLVQDEILQSLGDDTLLQMEAATKRVQVRHLACRISGIILSSNSNWKEKILQAFPICEKWQSAFGDELVTVEASLLNCGYILSRATLRHLVTAADSDGLINRLWALSLQILKQTTDQSLRKTTTRIIGQLAICAPFPSLYLEGAPFLIETLLAEAKKENEVAISSLGRLLCALWKQFTPEEGSKQLHGLYELHEVRKAEFQFAFGEAFAAASLRFNSSSTLTEFDVDTDRPRDGNFDLFSKLLDDILDKCKSTKPALKKASGIWLLSLVQFCTVESLLQHRLRDIQVAFSRLLTDRDEVVQETGSRGLGLVYEKGDKGLRDDLVRDLVQSFTGNTAKTAGTITEDTELFEAGALPTENGQSVTTYKDIVSLAQEMGDPSLVYRFMNLAANNAIWSSRAAFGRFGLSGVLADSAYLKENKKFYPKLFRYRFDPNPNVQRSMNEIWKALVKDSNAVIDENFDLIMEDLLQSIVSGRDWRAREASCSAISDLVQGRDVEKFEKHLDEIWRVAFKVLDDVKESVRVAAMKLCRSLTAMLVRNLEVGDGMTKRAKTMLGHAIPFLLQQMDAGAGKDVQNYAIVTLLDIVKKAPPRSLEKYAPVILETLINSLSSLEHESINYLHLNAEKYGLTAEKLDGMRVSSIGASPVTEAIEKCLDCVGIKEMTSEGNIPKQSGLPVIGSMQDAMKRIEQSFKSTIGLPSKVGLSRVMITLVVRHQTIFRPYADRFVRLTRKSILDRNATVSQSFSTALAYLLRLASEKEVRQTIAYAQKLYFESQEVSHRAVAGEMVQAISKASNDVFMKFGSSFMPFAFIGRKDLDDDARERFETAWKENAGGSRTLHLYLAEIVALTQQHITSSLWPVRHACCFAIADFVISLESGHVLSRNEALLVWPLVEESLSGKTWEGKERVILALPKFVKQAGIIWPDVGTQITKIALREAKRKNASYQPHAVMALAELLKIRPDLKISDEVVPFLENLSETLLSETDIMDVDDPAERGDRSSETLLGESVSSAITCLFAVLIQESTSNVLDRSLAIVEKLHDQNSIAARLILYQGATEFIENIVGKLEKGASGEPNSIPASGATFIGKNPQGQELARFLHGLVLALFGTDPQLSHAYHASDTENLRAARIRLASKLSHTRLISLATRETLGKDFSFWLGQERLKPLRLMIEEASQANSLVMDES